MNYSSHPEFRESFGILKLFVIYAKCFNVKQNKVALDTQL